MINLKDVFKSFTQCSRERELNSSRKKGFTLIELLVVIAIIGLLSSIVLVSMKGVRGQARITKTLEFSQSIRHVLGAEAVGIWDFDNCTAQDASGYGNHGTVYGATCVSDTPHSIIGQGSGKNAFSFNGSNHIAAPRVLTGNSVFTAEAWVKPFDTGSWRTIMGEGCSGFTLTINGGQLYFGKNCGPPWGHGPKIPVNDWTHVVITFNGINTDAYVNGIKYTGRSDLTYNHVNLYIGSYNGASEFFNGLIDEVRIYNQILTQAKIQKYYAEGRERHRNSVAQISDSISSD